VQEDAESNKALVSSLREQVTTLKQKLLVAENARRKLHNELQVITCLVYLAVFFLNVLCRGVLSGEYHPL
jgi:hypothetical protein